MPKSDSLPSWQQAILNQLDGRIAKCFIAGDPDSLLAEESLQYALQESGFQLYFFEDSIELRHYLSSQLGENHCVISINTDDHDIHDLPYDLVSSSQSISISLGDCFPDVTYSVLQSLQVEELNSLDKAIEEYTPGTMNESGSCDFVLRHVFKIAPEVIQTPSDLLRSLLRLHYRDVELPDALKKRFISLIATRNQFSHWPIAEIIASKRSFFSFLQRNWPEYVTKVLDALKQGIEEPKPVYQVSATSEEKIVLPFGHDDVRIYIDNLFLEGLLTPIDIDQPDQLTSHWSLVGIRQNQEEELRKRVGGLLKVCDETLPSESDRHQMWLQYAYRWGELSASYHSNHKLLNKTPKISENFTDMQFKLDSSFSGWMLEKFRGLHSHPPTPPVMLHHIPRAMARELDKSTHSKVALILIDGLSIDQWITVKTHLNLEEQIASCIEEAAVFAWIPTVTSVSRQALFSAKAPYQFASSINSTSDEPRAWRQFWQDHGLNQSQVFYKKSLGTDDVETLVDELSDRRLRAIGLVINTVDDMMHGMKLGAAGMHNQVKLWAESGYLKLLVEALLDKGFSVHLTSDHGNVESEGSGEIKEGSVAKSRGERARVYNTESLIDSIDFTSTDSLAWPRIGLPDDYCPVVMKGREAFVAKGKRIVSHGGIAIEEVVVPYITINRDINEQ